MLVRPLTLADTDDALRLYVSLTAGPKTAEAAHFASVLAHPDTWVFGAEVGGQVVSMATLHLLPNVTWGGRPYGVVENVVTAETHRGQGLGKAVVQAALTHAQSRTAYKVMLQSGVRRGARGFYEACGFECEGKFGFQVRWP